MRERTVAGTAALVCSLSIARGATLVGSEIPAASPVWHVHGEGRGVPAADASAAYFLSTNHDVVALGAATGMVRWRRATGESGSATAGSKVLLAGSNVIAGDYNVIAFNRTTGTRRWRFVPTDGYGPGIYLGNVIDGVVFAGSPAGRVYAIDTATGRLRWSALVADDGRTTVFQPLGKTGLVVAGYTTFTTPNVGGIAAFDAATGRERWRRAFPPSADLAVGTGWAGGPILTVDTVIAARGDGVIYGFDAADGSVRWSIPPIQDGGVRGAGAAPAGGTADFRALTLSRRTLVAGSLTGRIAAYDVRTRRERWRHSSSDDGSVNFQIGSDGRAVYVSYVSGRLLSLNLSDGTPRWRTGEGGGFLWSPRSFRTRLYAASTDGFFAFNW
jgi:outer membrane protein assembly factor BamB